MNNEKQLDLDLNEVKFTEEQIMIRDQFMQQGIMAKAVRA